MTPFQIKEANRYYWMIKGHLIPESWSEQSVEGIFRSYFERIWGNCEAPEHEFGFEAAWAKRQAERINRQRSV